MPSIIITGGMKVHYSPEDEAIVLGHAWFLQRTTSNGRFYAYAYLYYDDPNTGARRRKKIYMHRAITRCEHGYLVDHKDRDGLNNRRWNLRITTGTYNNANHEPYNVLGYRGVTKCGRRYRARISFHYEEIHLGCFDTAREAAEAYDRKALELFGEFAWLNFDKTRAARESDIQVERDLETIPF